MNRIQKLINEIEKIRTDLPKEVYVWSGSGYVLDTLDVTEYLGDRNEISIEEVAMLCLKNNVGEVITCDTFRKLVDESMYYDKVTEEEAEEIVEQTYYYCDLTGFDNIEKCFEICYLNIENLRCSDNIEIHS